MYSYFSCHMSNIIKKNVFLLRKIIIKAIVIYGSCIIYTDNHNDYSNLYNKI